jgi:hypothetical protein
LPPDDWHIVRSIVLERDGHACVYCGADKPLEGDHIVPLSRGGSNALTNLATACRPCNLSKASSTPEEWRFRRMAAVAMNRGTGFDEMEGARGPCWKALIPSGHSRLFGRIRSRWAPWVRPTSRAMRASSVILSSVLRIRDIGNEAGA